MRDSAATGAIKANLDRDLRLAETEIESAERLDPAAEVVMGKRVLGIRSFRSVLHANRGIVDYINGSRPAGRQHLERAAQFEDTAYVQYWLAQIAGDDKDRLRALQHLERCLTLDPDGPLSIPALQQADELKRASKSGCVVLLVPVLLPLASGVVSMIV